MGWNYLSIPKLQRCNRWSLGMDKWFHTTLYNGCNYLSMLGLKLNHVSKRGRRKSAKSMTDNVSSADQYSRQHDPEYAKQSEIGSYAVEMPKSRWKGVWFTGGRFDVKIAFVWWQRFQLWTIIHCLGLGHVTMVCAVCLSIDGRPYFCTGKTVSLYWTKAHHVTVLFRSRVCIFVHHIVWFS